MVFAQYLETEFRDLRLVLSRWVTFMFLKYVVHWTQKYDQGVHEDDSIYAYTVMMNVMKQ